MLWIGWVSSICLTICGIPLAIEAIYTGEGLDNKWFLWLWYIGELTGLIYCVSLTSYPLIFNYGLNLLIISPVLYYSYRPRRKK